MKLTYQNLEEIDQIAEKIIKFAQNHTIWLLEGEMGAGKTTLIQSICKNLGVVDTVQSPTFSIVNEYHTSSKKVIYHFDFYRLKSEIEALDMGYEEYFYSENLCLIEWGSKIPSLIPFKHILIQIFLENSQRTLELISYE